MFATFALATMLIYLSASVEGATKNPPRAVLEFTRPELGAPRYSNLESFYLNKTSPKPIKAARISRILTPPLSKRGSKIAHQLSLYLSNVWDQPMMLLIDNTKYVHNDAKKFMPYILNVPEVVPEFWLMKFNNTGVSPVLANSGTDKNYFLKCLEWSAANDNKRASVLVPEPLEKTVAFYGIIKAASMLPINSGIVVFTDRPTEDEDLAQLALKELGKKHIKVYVVWVGLYPTIGGEETLLREIAAGSGGMFFVGNSERTLSTLYKNAYLQNPDALKSKAIVGFYRRVTHVLRKSFPIDGAVKSIHVTITSKVKSATLISPKGKQVDLLTRLSVERFSDGSFSTHETDSAPYQIQLNIEGSSVSTPVVGMWQLYVDASGENATSDVIISVQTKLNVTTYVTTKLDDHVTLNRTDLPKDKKVLRVALSGEFTDVEDITLVDKRGLIMYRNVSFTHKYLEKEPLINADNITNPKQEVDIDFNRLPYRPFYLKISGQDENGTAFLRLSYYDRQRINYGLRPLTVEVGAGSELLLKPRQYGKIFFEVTNNGDQVMYVHFRVEDEKSLLARMEPKSAWINPQQTIVVTVVTYGSFASVAQYRDLITFTVSGPETVKKSAALYVTDVPVSDDTQPRLTHRYTSDCRDVIFKNCIEGTWMIEVTAEDRDSGLLQLTSTPKGLFFHDGYIAGTKESATGVYGGSCCQPKIQLTAIDLAYNRNSYTADAYSAVLSAGSISAIILGIMLFILILVIIVIACRVKCCKNKDSQDLPRYQGPNGRLTTLFYASRVAFNSNNFPGNRTASVINTKDIADIDVTFLDMEMSCTKFSQANNL